MSKRPPTPAEVERQLRQESGFGCAACGNPILDYHHIIPWEEREHFEPAHMIALCPTCHREFGKRARNDQYRIKENPINIRKKRFNGHLYSNRTDQKFRLGGIRYEGVETAISFAKIPIFGFRIHENQTKLNFLIPDHIFLHPEIEIVENNVNATKAGFWDILFTTNYIKFRRKKGEIFLEIDLRGDEISVRGAIELFGEKYQFKNDGTEFPNGSSIGKNSVVGSPGGTGLGLGPENKRLIRPNYGMVDPKPFYVSQ